MAQKPAWSVGARQGPLRRHKQLVFFACEGLIALHDERDKAEHEDAEYTVITPEDFEYRAKGIRRFALKAQTSDKLWQRKEAKLMKQASYDMMETVKEARRMGSPNNPEVRAFWARHRRANSVICNYEHGVPAKALKQMNAEAPNTGRTAVHTLDEAGLEKIKDDNIKIRRLPVKKERKSVIMLDV